ncbi:MAG: hypothetical protein L0387_11725, partial [Acidobacteria bacterium]|nr:hypothetical protein [Acidobacteriota bacterium]
SNEFFVGCSPNSRPSSQQGPVAARPDKESYSLDQDGMYCVMTTCRKFPYGIHEIKNQFA